LSQKWGATLNQGPKKREKKPIKGDQSVGRPSLMKERKKENFRLLRRFPHPKNPKPHHNWSTGK